MRAHCILFLQGKDGSIVEEVIGAWSSKIPECVRACTYPGTAIGGMINEVQFYYKVGSSVRFNCVAGLEIQGARMLKCLPNGNWSAAVPTCNKPEETL